ncbi:RDD family protein [Flavobacterium sp. FBOR7N2.3]|uniref:RDD family protein n=1 Tax=Flavobacterium magnesitis TaxID=3138077 RepID=A0ABV4TKX6_9FLAO
MKNEGFTITDDLQASQLQRFLNLIIDLLFIYILVLSLGTTIILVALSVDNFALSNWVTNLSAVEIGFYTAIVAFLYYYITEVYFSRTIAKLLTRTIVVNTDGTKPSKRIVFIRTCCRFIPFEAFTFLRKNGLGLHDEYSKTFVVRKGELIKKRKENGALETVVQF